ncbi:MAG: adenylyltransferase/cytidyltransferase family protein, partial [Promethearchaeota archaeon]
IRNVDELDHLYEILDTWQRYWRFYDDLARFQEFIENTEPTSTLPLFIGRFQPFHLGHLECIKHITRDHKNLIVGIGSPQYARFENNPLKFDERKEMIQKVLKHEKIRFDNLFIIPILDTHSENIWMINIKELFSNRIALYSNNDWVRGLAKRHGIPLGVKLEFKIHDYNGTNIRKLIQGEGRWDELVPAATKTFLNETGLINIIKNLKRKG